MADNKPQKINEAAIEFLPDALELQQEKLPFFAKIGVFWLFLIIASVVAWACLGEVDVIVRATGKIVSRKGDIVMKPLTSAVIKSIDVAKGDIVKEGQVLVRFDPAVNQAEYDRIEREIRALEAEAARYMAEFVGKPYVVSQQPNQHQQWQQAIYKQRNDYYTERINYFDSNVRRLQSAWKSTQESCQKYTEILKNMQKIETMYTNLQESNIVSHKELLEVIMQRLQSEAQVNTMRNQLTQYEQEQLSMFAEKNSFIEEWRNAISEKLVEINRELEGNRRQLEKAKTMLSYETLCAPCRGIIHEIAPFPVGSAVGEAEAFVTIVPLDAPLEAQVELKPQDIGKVKIASPARIKLNAFPFQKFGTLDGSVRLISPNTFSSSAPSPTGEPAAHTFYRGAIALSGHLKNIDPATFQLIPGMELEAEIKADRRRIITYLVYPLIKGLDESFREP